MKILVLKLLWNITRILRYMDIYIYCVYYGISPLDSKPTGLKFSKVSKLPNLTMTLFIVDLPYDLPLKGCYEKKRIICPKRGANIYWVYLGSKIGPEIATENQMLDVPKRE